MRSSPLGVCTCAWQVGHVGTLPLALPQHTERTGSCKWGAHLDQGSATLPRPTSGLYMLCIACPQAERPGARS